MRDRTVQGSISSPEYPLKTPKRLEWLDFCRGAAMIAVIIDHTQHLYSRTFVLHTAFSVTAFVFLGGITSRISLERRNGLAVAAYLFRRLRPILLSYIFATAAYRIYFDDYVLSVPKFFSSIVLFDAAPPFYFVLFYAQLVAVSPFVDLLLGKIRSVMGAGILVAAMYGLSLLLIKHTYVLNVHGGGKYLFGGTYLYVFVMGMAAFAYLPEIMERKHFWHILAPAALLLFAVYEYAGYAGTAWANPPNGYTVVYTMVVLSILALIWIIAADRRLSAVAQLPLSYVALVGRHSLNIFLYHTLIIGCINKYLPLGHLPDTSSSAKGFAYILMATLIPIGAAKLIPAGKWLFSVGTCPEMSHDPGAPKL